MSYEDPFSAASAIEWFNNKEWKGAQMPCTCPALLQAAPADGTVCTGFSPCVAWSGKAALPCLSPCNLFYICFTHAAPPWPVMLPVGCKLSVSLSERKADPNASYGRGGGGGGYRCALSPHGHATSHDHDCFSALCASVVGASLCPLSPARRGDAWACADLCACSALMQPGR